MNGIDIINKLLNSNYQSLKEVYDKPEVLTLSLDNVDLYKYISNFDAETWTKDNQDKLADILHIYLEKNSFPYNIKNITSSKLVTRCYELNQSTFYYKVDPSALNEENVRLAFEKRQYNANIFRNNPLALKVYIKGNYLNCEFSNNVWNEENAKLYIKRNNNIKINSFYSNIICYKETIKLYRFDLLNDFFINEKLDNETGMLLYEKMLERPNSIVQIKSSPLKGIETYYLKALIELKRFDLVKECTSEQYLDDTNIKLIANNIDEYLNATNGNLDYIFVHSEDILESIIKHEYYELTSKFYDEKTWTEKNIKLFFDKNIDKKYYDRFKWNALALKVYCLGNYNIDIPFSNFDERIVWTDENIELYFDYIKRNNPDNIIYSFCYITNYFNRCLEHNVFKYLNKSIDKNIDYNLLSKKITEFPNAEFNFNDLLLKNTEVVKAIIKSKKFDILDKASTFIEKNEEIIEYFASTLKEYLDLGYAKIPFCFKNEPKILKQILLLKRYDILNEMNTYAYDKDNISLTVNAFFSDKIPFYDVSCRSEEYFWFALQQLNLPDEFIKYKRGIVNYEAYKDPFFRYLTNNKIGDFSYLITYYKSQNILDDYIKDGYLTEKFKSELIFNYHYQNYCKISNIDITANIDSPVILNYLKVIYNVPTLHKGIFINETNYELYFDEKGIKDELYDFLYKGNSLDILKNLLEKYPKKEYEDKEYLINRLLEINNYKIMNKCLEYLKNNNKCDKQTVDNLIDLVFKAEYSNSMEIYNFKEQIIESVLNSDNPNQKFDEIEQIFLKNNIPMFAKVFICFNILYPNFQKYDKSNQEVFDFSAPSRMSPELLDLNLKNERMNKLKKLGFTTEAQMRFQILFNDLLRLSIESDNKSLKEFMSNLKIGSAIIENKVPVNKLNESEINSLNILCSYLETIVKSKNQFNSLEEKINYFINYFKPTKKYTLADRVVRSYCYFAGIDSLKMLENKIKECFVKAKQKDNELGEYLNTHQFTLKDNDLLRCIGGFDILDSSLENGNVCKELLGTFTGKSDSDTTPCDVDFTLIKESDNLYSCIDGTPTGWGFGNIFIVIDGNDERINITRDKDGNRIYTKYDPFKTEFFGTHIKNKGYETHWGARSGISNNIVKCYIYKKKAPIDSNKPYNEDGTINYTAKSFDDLPYVKFAFVRKGVYKPIVDLSGKKIFSIEEFNYMRSKMQGLSYYGISDYHIDPKSLYFEGIEDLINEIEHDRIIVEQNRNIILDKIKEILESSDIAVLSIKHKLSNDISEGIVQLLETGSTSRFSNVPGDTDFDFMLKLDKKYISNKNEIEKLKKQCQEKLNPTESIPTKPNRFRGSGIKLPGIDSFVDIDISFDQKRNNSNYSSEMALNDRYNMIKKEHPNYYPYVLANVVKAKELFKTEKVYKKEDGGMGGIGVENWILQNGGSLKSAIKDFLSHTYNSDGTIKDFETFKHTYQVWDFGSNHEPREIMKNVYYAYDNYINNLTEQSYLKIVNLLQNYINELDNTKAVTK